VRAAFIDRGLDPIRLAATASSDYD
jgi:hypothetical protein